jgi:hypothetical protein
MLMLRQAKAIYDNAQQTIPGMKTHLNQEGVTKQQLDQARLTLTNAGSNLKQANINVGEFSKSTKGFINKRFIEPFYVGWYATPCLKLLMFLIKVDCYSRKAVASLKLGSPVNVTAVFIQMVTEKSLSSPQKQIQL